MADSGKIESLLIAQRDGVRPECVFVTRTKGVEATSQRCRRMIVAKRCGVSEDSYHTILRNRTRGPSTATMNREPLMRSIVIDVIGVKKSDEDVDVQQSDTHDSSRSRLTSSIVSG